MSTPATPVKSVTMSTIESRKGEKESIVDGLKSTAGGDYMNGIETEKIVDSTSLECRVYSKRWLVLFLFVFYSMTNAFQWMQFCIISNQVTSYYGISSQMVDMTSMIYMFMYIPLIFPSSYLIEQKGLRIGVLLGSFGTAVGAWIKVFSANPNRWWVAFTGQTIVAISQIFVLGIPPLLAALWFPSDQVSTATSIGVFGNQLGVAAGFLLPTMIVSNGTSEEIGYRLSIMYYGTGAVTAAVFVLAVFFFQDRPAKPPSLAQSALLSTEKENYVVSMKRLLTNKGYLLLLTSYGVNVGVFYAISTVLADFVLKYFPDAMEDVGKIGLSIVLSGMVGSVISGLVLDKTRKYKETTLVLYMLSLVGMIAYTLTLPNANHIAWIYVVMASLGFFMTGYLPVGFEFAAEITYPESEGTSSGLLNAAAQVFGLILTPAAREVFTAYDSDVGANTLLCITLALGLLMTSLIKPDLRRLAAQETRTSLNPDNSNNSQIVGSLGSEEA